MITYPFVFCYLLAGATLAWVMVRMAESKGWRRSYWWSFCLAAAFAILIWPALVVYLFWPPARK